MTDVTIAELKKIKRDIEQDIAKQISAKLTEFQHRTGVSVAGIEVSCLAHYTAGHPEPDFVLIDNVNIKVELGV